MSETVDQKTVEALVAGHRGFLKFLERRVKSAAVAEEILQSAFVRALEKGIPATDSEESIVAWFYRVLRNALVDHYRRQDVERRGLEKERREAVDLPETLDAATKGEVCACMSELLPALKDEYAAILKKVDLEEGTIGEVAEREGITTNNATVRLHRARQALKKQLQRSCGTCAEHGCLDCSCGKGRA